MTKKLLAGLATGLLLVCMVGVASAALISPDNITGTGEYNDLPRISDGVYPSEGGSWRENTTWWIGTAPTFTFDYGQAFNIDDIILSVDNNDSYRVDYSSNSTDWNALFTLDSGIGEIGWGMDTMTTITTHPEYQYQIDFSTSVTAQYLRIQAIGGDNFYSIGEFQAVGSAAPVPEPATMLLLGTGLAGLAGTRLRRKKKA